MMKFYSTKKELLPVLKLIKQGQEPRPNIDILKNVLIRASYPGKEIVSFTVTDLETSTVQDIRCRIETGGECTVELKALIDAVQGAGSGEICFDLDNIAGVQVLTVRDSAGGVRLECTAVDEYPMLPILPEKYLQDISYEDIRAALEKTIYAIPLEDTRYALLGALFEIEKEVKIVATDTHRLSLAVINDGVWREKKSFIAPLRALKVLLSAVKKVKLGVEIQVRDTGSYTAVFFRCGSVIVQGRCLDGEYPAWNKVVPGYQSAINKGLKLTTYLDVSTALNGVKKLLPFTSKNKAGVFTFNNTTIQVEVVNSERGKVDFTLPAAVEKVQVDGPDIQAKYNLKYLQDIFKNARNKLVKLNIYDDTLRAVFFEESGHLNNTVVVMPMRF